MDGDSPMDHRAAQQAVLALLPQPRIARVPLDQAARRVLAEDVATLVDHPPFDNAAMDGYAVRSDDLATTPTELQVVATAAAGHPTSVALGPGQAARILTGAVMVAGADTVVPVEDTDAGHDRVVVRAASGAGAHVRRAGEGARRGDVVLRAGTVLHAGHLGLAASSGVAELAVVSPARVAVLTTGDELVPVGTALGPGQIHESNAVTVAALAARAGATVAVHHGGDDAAALRVLLEELAADHDVVLTTGGVSMGAEYDAVRVALADAEVRVVKLSIRPAKPLAFGTLGTALFVGLPGNPVSAVVSFELFVRPALRRLAGIDPAVPPTTTGPAGERLTHPGGPATHFVRVRCDDGSWVGTGSGGSHLIAGIAAADALAVLPPGSDVAPGEPVTLVELWT
jgi:molybdopterin molybdotransferase